MEQKDDIFNFSWINHVKDQYLLTPTCLNSLCKCIPYIIICQTSGKPRLYISEHTHMLALRIVLHQSLSTVSLDRLHQLSPVAMMCFMTFIDFLNETGTSCSCWHHAPHSWIVSSRIDTSAHQALLSASQQHLRIAHLAGCQSNGCHGTYEMVFISKATRTWNALLYQRNEI